MVSLSIPTEQNNKSTEGPAASQFPGKLHDLMSYAERQGFDDVVSWVEDGLAIMVHDSKRLLEILPMFGFGQTKYRSFERQLNMWHWERIVQGPYKGAWKHPFFIRGNKLLCGYMSRRKLSNPSIPASVLFSNNVQSNGRIDKETNIPIKVPFSLDQSGLKAKEVLSFSYLEKDSIQLLDNDLFSPRPIGPKMTPFDSKTLHYVEDIDPTPILEASTRDARYRFDSAKFMKNNKESLLLEPLPADAFETLFQL